MSTGRLFKSLIMALPCLAFIAGCTRPNGGGVSRLVIQAPKSLSKVGGLSVPTNRKACWGANVTADDLAGTKGSTCSPKTGVVAGYKLSGEVITASVAKGAARLVELYLYLLPENDNGACPVMSAVVPPSQLANTFVVGKTVVNFELETTEVTITANFPGEANNLLVSNAMPATCLVGLAPGANGPPPPFKISIAQKTVSNGTNTLRASVTFAPAQGDLTNSSYKLKLK